MAGRRQFGKTSRSFSPILSTLLKEARVTHPDEMRGASRQKQNALMHKQISAFEKLVQHGMSKFSKEKLHRMLTEIVPLDTKITSFGDLRELVQNAEETRTDIEILTIAKYFTAFYNDIEYLRKMKSHFDERIYSVLYEFYYDPVVEDLITVKKDLGTNGMQSRRKAEILKKVNQEKNLPGVASFNDLMEESDTLSAAMADLKDLAQQWQMLLDDDEEVDGNLFDDESSQELLAFSNYKHFEHVFRYVPDVLLKSYNAIELAKRWWVSADKINNMLYKEELVSDNGGADGKVGLNEKEIAGDKYGESEQSRNHDDGESGNEADDEDDHHSVAISNDSENIGDMINELEERLRELIRSINRHEADLQVQQSDLKTLINREARVGQLAGNLEKTVTSEESIIVQIHRANVQKDELMTKIRKVKKDSVQYRNLYGQLSKLDTNLKDLELSSNYHNYEHNILAGDLDVELEVQPSMIRFVGDVQDKVNQLETWLGTKKSEKRRVEKELVMLKAGNDEAKRSSGSSRSTSSDLERSRPRTSDTVIITRTDDKSRKYPMGSKNSDKQTNSDVSGTRGDLLRSKPKIHHHKMDSGGKKQREDDKHLNNNDTTRSDENAGNDNGRGKGGNNINPTGTSRRSTSPNGNAIKDSNKSKGIELSKARVHPRHTFEEKKPEDTGKSKTHTRRVSPPTTEQRRGSRIPVRT